MRGCARRRENDTPRRGCERSGRAPPRGSTHLFIVSFSSGTGRCGIESWKWNVGITLRSIAGSSVAVASARAGAAICAGVRRGRAKAGLPTPPRHPVGPQLTAHAYAPPFLATGTHGASTATVCSDGSGGAGEHLGRRGGGLRFCAPDFARAPTGAVRYAGASRRRAAAPADACRRDRCGAGFWLTSGRPWGCTPEQCASGRACSSCARPSPRAGRWRAPRPPRRAPPRPPGPFRARARAREATAAARCPMMSEAPILTCSSGTEVRGSAAAGPRARTAPRRERRSVLRRPPSLAPGARSTPAVPCRSQVGGGEEEVGGSQDWGGHSALVRRRVARHRAARHRAAPPLRARAPAPRAPRPVLSLRTGCTRTTSPPTTWTRTCP